MAVTTLTQFMAALGGMAVTGVTRAYTSPPTQVSTADLPCSYPRLPSAIGGPIVACGNNGWPQYSAELVILVEPLGQERQPTNWAKVLTMIDALQTALASTALAKTKTTWTVRQEIAEPRTDTFYWAIVAQVTANG